jgi:hypothetical protein
MYRSGSETNRIEAILAQLPHDLENGVRLGLVACRLRVDDGPRLRQIRVGRHQLEHAEPSATKTSCDNTLFGISIGQEFS